MNLKKLEYKILESINDCYMQNIQIDLFKNGCPLSDDLKEDVLKNIESTYLCIDKILKDLRKQHEINVNFSMNCIMGLQN